MEKEKGFTLDRKVLSEMAVENPEIFAKFVEKVK
jgi:ribosomal protein L20